MATVTLPANGAYAAGFNPPTVVGTTPIGDTDDATWLDFPQGGGNATVGVALPDPTMLLTGPVALHLRLQVLADTPAGVVGEVFLNTEADGGSDTEFAGFSDGTTSGFGFVVPEAASDGIVDLTVPLSLTAWAPTTLDDVLGALYAGCYLDFNAWNWVAGDDPPTIRVYEAWVEVSTSPLACVVETFDGDGVDANVDPSNTIFTDVGFWEFGADGRDGQGSYGESGRLDYETTPASSAHASIDFRPLPWLSNPTEGIYPLELWVGAGDDRAVGLSVRLYRPDLGEPARFVAASDLTGSLIEADYTPDDVLHWWHISATLDADQITVELYDETGALVWVPAPFAAAGALASGVSTRTATSQGYQPYVDNVRYCVLTARPRLRNLFTDEGRNYPPDRFRRNVGRQP